MPPPSPELVALRVMVLAHWRTLKPRQKLMFQKALTEVLHDLDEDPITLRPSADHAAVKASRLRGGHWVRRVMGDILRTG